MRTIHLTLLLATVACGGPTVEGETEASGAATYPEASDSTDEATVPDEQGDGMTVTIEASGTADFELPSADCPTDLGGNFSSLYEGEATISDGVYLAAFSETSAEVVSPSGCTISDLTGAVYTDVVIRGELVATSESCETYCDGWAASEAEAQCEGDADEATCRSTAQTSLGASCTQECTTQTDVIVAEASLGAEALTALNAAGLTGAALGVIEVDLHFDRMEDSSGGEVDPAG